MRRATLILLFLHPNAPIPVDVDVPVEVDVDGDVDVDPTVDVDVDVDPVDVDVDVAVDVDVDGSLTTDSRNHLVPDENFRRFLDHFLIATGDATPDSVLHARIAAAIESRLRPPASSEALALLDRYFAYREAARHLAASPPNGDLADRWSAIRALRRDTLGEPAATALFTTEDALIDAALARRRGEDPSTFLPPSLRSAEEHTLLPLLTQRREAALLSDGADPSQIRALRETRFGPEAADRLEALDRARADFQRRLALLRSGGGTLDQLFTPEEKRRVEALERLAAH